jgi:hypothetical protein
MVVDSLARLQAGQLRVRDFLLAHRPLLAELCKELSLDTVVLINASCYRMVLE